MVDFAKLKRDRDSGDNLGKLTEAIKALNSNDYAADENEWQPTADKSDTGSAEFRFLPPPAADGPEALPWVKYWKHGFKGPTGKWLVAECPTTLGEQCPICDSNSELWNTEIKANKDLASNRKRKLVHVSNIYMINDPAKPSNNGKVFKFNYGKKIMDKIESAMHPDPAFKSLKAFNPFDLWSGANFQLRFKKVDNFRSYEASSFGPVGPLLDDDSELEKIYNSEHPLLPLVDPKVFKSYDELQKKLHKVLGLNALQNQSSNKAATAVDDTPPWKEAVKRAPVASGAADEGDDDLKYFQELASD